ncbi:hypothetical protein CNY89_29740, partial [Amaricoccus sp. HAR-UPW-R2A-40]
LGERRPLGLEVEHRFLVRRLGCWGASVWPMPAMVASASACALLGERRPLGLEVEHRFLVRRLGCWGASVWPMPA